MADSDRRESLLATARWADPAYISDKYFFEPGDIWIRRNPHNFDSAVGGQTYRTRLHVRQYRER